LVNVASGIAVGMAKQNMRPITLTEKFVDGTIAYIENKIDDLYLFDRIFFYFIATFLYIKATLDLFLVQVCVISFYRIML